MFEKLFLLDLDASINAVDGIYWEQEGTIRTVVVAVGENRICVWVCHKGNKSISHLLCMLSSKVTFLGTDNIKLLHKCVEGPVLFLDCKIQLLPECGVPVIACAGDDGNIHLFCLQLIGNELSCLKTLKVSGHEDWVRTVAFTVDGKSFDFVPCSHEPA